MMRKLAAIATVVFVCAASAAACTTFCLRNAGRVVFGKNYDWNVEDGLLMVNKRAVRRSADAGEAKNPAQWTAKYGSVTFNQYGRDFPSGGINEAGLVIELMWADGSKYPRPDARPSVNCLEWIQYQLDTASSVAEVIASDARIRIQSDTPLHYLVADGSGQVATIEFIGGKLVAHTGANLPVAALANHLYAESLQHLRDTPWLPPDGGSKARFLRAADRVKNFRDGDAVAYAFKTLANVANEGHTKWSIVYEIDRGQLHFRTYSNPRIRTLSLKQLDFSCASPVMVFDLKAGNAGEIAAALRPYSRQENLRLIRSSFSQTDFLAGTSQTELTRIASLPESSTCALAALK